MGSSTSRTRNKGGQPSTDATPVMVRIRPTPLAAPGGHIAQQPDPKPSRPEMIRKILEDRLVREGLIEAGPEVGSHA